MALPCEEAIWSTLPQIRADLARELVKNGVRQKDIADLLCLTPSAVSQYVHKKRGGTKRKTPEYKKMISEAAEKITKPKANSNKIICHLCTKTRSV